MSEGTMLTASDLQLNVAQHTEEIRLTGRYDDEDEEQLVRQAVNRCRGNVSAAAKMLNISRPTLYAKMKKYGL